MSGAIIRKYWCSWRAGLYDSEPVVSLEDILGGGMPAEVLARFHGKPDEIGEIDFYEVSRCPLHLVDDLSPHYDPGWLAEVYEAVSALNFGAPSNWLPSAPSSAFRDAVIMVKSEQDHASAFRAKHEEDW